MPFYSSKENQTFKLLTNENISEIDLGGQPIQILELVEMVQKFTNSQINADIISLDPLFKGGFDIDKSSLFRILSQDYCEGIRIYFSIVTDEVTQKDKLTLSFIGIKIDRVDLLKLDSDNKIILDQDNAEEKVHTITELTLVQQLVSKR